MKEAKNTLHQTLHKKRPIDTVDILRERLKCIKKGVKTFFMDECGFHHDPSRVRRLGLPSDYPSVIFLCLMVFRFL